MTMDLKQITEQYFEGDDFATGVWKKKYAGEEETSPDQMWRRMAKEFFRIEEKFGGEYSEEDFYNSFKNFKYIVPQGSVMSGLGTGKLVSYSNCTVVESPRDSMNGIMEVGTKLMNLSKRRCGVGFDISSLRPDGELVNNSAKTSSGAWSFANLFSDIAKSVGQSGRRAALMLPMDVSHPDIFKFVTSKKDNSKVTAANISVKITDEFMNAVVSDGDFDLTWGGKKYRTIKARELWSLIIHMATTTAEPGILFWDRHLEYNPSSAYPLLRPISTNPCGEVPLGKSDSCRLLSMNLMGFVVNPFTPTAYFDFELFAKEVRKIVHLVDNLVELEIESLQRIVDQTDEVNEKAMWQEFIETGRAGRRSGLSQNGLADVLVSLGFKYDSDEAIRFTDNMMRIYRDTAYDESVELSKVRGSFDLFDWEAEKENEFIKALPDSVKEKMAKYGRRNVTLLTCAPAGSVSIVSRTSSGIEPIFSLFYDRKRKLNHDEDEEGKSVFVSEDGQKFEVTRIYHPLAKKAYEMFGKDFETKTKLIVAGESDWQKRIQMQSTIQKYVDNSISSTINLPRGTKEEVVSKIYEEAWRNGLKGVTVYVEGSREGILTTVEEKKETSFGYLEAPKRPERLNGDIFFPTIKGEQWIVIVGLMDGKPYEVFAGLEKYVSLPKKFKDKFKKGVIVKRNKKSRSEYDLVIAEGTDDEMIFRDIVTLFENANHGAFGRMISLSLRHGSKPQYVAEQLLKDTDFDFTSYSKIIARILKKYVQDGEISGDRCEECGETLRYENGCATCPSCGYSKCG